MITGLQLSSEQFYAAYDAFAPFYLIMAFKVISPKLDTTIKKITVDIMLAFVWADFIDRCMGVVTTEPRDYLLIGFIVMAMYKHTLFKLHTQWLKRNSTLLLQKYLG
jgi:uncharacterized membrane protein required for colicin V production